MNQVIPFPILTGTTSETEHDTPRQSEELPAIANTLTITLIQQALDDACESKDWKGAKKKIEAAVKRGRLRIVSGP
jgi:hypothetical protein